MLANAIDENGCEQATGTLITAFVIFNLLLIEFALLLCMLVFVSI